jgi:TonB-linked SusC/RagA family outer membrane protein
MAATAALATGAAAQGGGTVTGRVTAAENGTPLSGANVSVQGTTRRTVTNAQGEYRITNIPAGAYTISASYLGRDGGSQQVRVTNDGTATANFALAQRAIELDAITVNAVTGQEERRREVGVNVAQINVGELEKAPITKVADVLNGRTAGVQLQGVAGSVGTAQKIRIRGANSLSLSNEPLVYVDGVLFSTSNLGIAVGGQEPSRLNDINPADIENIEILKGPAASALYGTAAANGVILITTKRGRAGSAKWNGYVEMAEIEDKNDYPNNYRAYSLAIPGAPLFTGSGAFNAAARPVCRNYQAAAGACTQDSVLSFNVLRDPRTTPFTKGSRQKIGMNVSGGSDVLTYFISGDWEDEGGVISYNNQEKVNLRANMTARIRDNLNLQITSGYVNGSLAFPQNDNNIFSPLINGIAGSAVFFPDEGGDVSRRNYLFGFNQTDLRNLVTNQDIDRFTLGANASYQPLSWLRANANLGMDLVDRFDFETLQPNRLPIAAEYELGYRDSRRANSYLYTVNTSAAAEFNLMQDLVSTTTIGASYQRTMLQGTEGFGVGLVEGLANLGATSSLFSVAEPFSEVRTVGALVQQQLAFRDRLFFSGSVRGDDNSAFGSDFGFIYYPAASLSWVVFEEPWFPKLSFLSGLRLRAAYGTSGLRPEFRDAETTFSPVSVAVNDADVPGVTLLNTGNTLLEPEKSTEFEFGGELGLFDDRIGLDFTYFNKKSEDALISRPLAPSFGLTQTILDNLGSIRNKGTELGLRVVAFDRPNARLDFRVQATTLDNEILDMGEVRPGKDVDPILLNRGNQRHQEGYSAGGFWGKTISFNDANGDGLLAIADVTTSDTAVFLGPVLPEWSRSLQADLSLFGFITVSTLFDSRGGNKQLNYTEFFRCRQSPGTGLPCRGVSDPTADLEDQARFIAASLLPAAQATQSGYVEDADFVKWRELSLTLGVPEALSRRFRQLSGMSLTLSGRNLKTWTDYTGLDPEINETGGDTNFTQGEFNTQPPVRYFVARLNFTF